MAKSHLKIAVIVGLVTAGVISVYQLFNLLLVYHYFKFEYYIAIIAIVFLLIGIVVTRRYYSVAPAAAVIKDPAADLTTKELQVLLMIYQGKSNKEIAALNFVEVSTIKTHINNIYAKLGISNRKEVAVVYHQHLSCQKSTLSPPAII